jgi:hypothetical protein
MMTRPMIQARPEKLSGRKLKIGVRGFEPPTTWSRTKCATRLRYTPKNKNLSIMAGTMFQQKIKIPLGPVIGKKKAKIRLFS